MVRLAAVLALATAQIVAVEMGADATHVGAAAAQWDPPGRAAELTRHLAAFTPPPDVRRIGQSASGALLADILRAVDTPATNWQYRLKTSRTAAEILDHYIPQAEALGWKLAARAGDPALGLARLTAGTSDDPLTGILTVVRFPSTEQVVVNVRLVRSRAPWRAGGRSGGGGASTLAPQIADFGDLAPELTLPTGVMRVETRSGWGDAHSTSVDVRLNTLLSAATLAAAIQSQLVTPPLKVETTLGDPLQRAIRLGTGETDELVLVVLLTALPGAREVDFVISRIGPAPGR